MKPQLGDIVISRYTLVSPLRSVPGLEAWKANDRVLARDCQLFIVTDKAAIPSFEAIASTLTLSRNPHFTPVIQMQRVDDVPVLITQLDRGLSLNDFIGHGTRKLSYTAMHSVIAEVADGLETLLRDDLGMKSLSTDIIRITSKGVQIADAPLQEMFTDTPAQRSLQPEMRAIHELASLIYAMLIGKWTSEIKDFDLSALPEDTPEELRIICERGLPINDTDGSPTLSMVSLSELVALLGEAKPLATLPASEIKRPNSDGEASIQRLPLRRTRPNNLLDFPQNLSTNQLQFRARQAQSAATKGANTAAGAAGAGALASAARKQGDKAASKAATSTVSGKSAASSQSGANPVNAGSPNKSKASKPTDGTNRTPDKAPSASSQHTPAPLPLPASAAQGTPSGSANNANSNPDAPQSPNPKSSQDKSSKWWRQHGKSGSNQPGASDDLTNAAAPRMDLHDLTAAEMADAFKSFDSTADDSIFSDFDQNAVQNTNPTMQFDFAMKGDVDGTHDVTPGNRTEATGRIPLLDANGNFIEPGHESAQALQAEQEAIDAANPVITPPSFTPQQRAHQQSTNPTSDDIADTPLLGKLTTKAVAIIAVIVLILAAAGVAAFVLTGHNSRGAGSYQQSSSDPWPDMNLNKVPFGAQGNGAGNDAQGSASSESSKKQNSDSSNGSSNGSTSKSEAGSSSSSSSKVITSDKVANAVPAPSIPVNNTPLTIDKQEFYRQPAGQNGLAYYMHVSDPATVTRFVVQIRTSGGTGYLIANTTQDPNAGQQVAQFTFDESGTTEVKLAKPVKSQDFMLWVPMDSLPNHSLYINHVQLF
ncbi:hypothetical protein OZX74_00280 [Bifidobacterium sp. ESL0798]|uniref:hypothetical protein n=1 Tax=Bifidobacterium sp. ESL0798 TaxID=2983235 RepID=UPI0023F938FA|nr:hypothetical protein [Bifidobacterium sp. ESL0798]WEV74053.1 hypothetical protein OZX74_00280 [Bifidobacterium sp. ESL0798]